MLLFRPVLHLDDVFAQAQAVFAEVRAGAVALSALHAAQRHPVAFAGERAGDGVVGPGGRFVLGLDDHLLLGGALDALGHGPAVQLAFRQQFPRGVLIRRRGQAQGQLFLQDQGDGRRPVQMAGLALMAADDLQPVAIRRVQGQGDDNRLLQTRHLGKGHLKLVRREQHLLIDINGHRPRARQHRRRLRSQKLLRLEVVQAGKFVVKGELGGRLRGHVGPMETCA